MTTLEKEMASRKSNVHPDYYKTRGCEPVGPEPFIKLKRRPIHGCVSGLEPGMRKLSLSGSKKEVRFGRNESLANQEAEKVNSGKVLLRPPN
jgi:hypothetical protein